MFKAAGVSGHKQPSHGSRLAPSIGVSRSSGFVTRRQRQRSSPCGSLTMGGDSVTGLSASLSSGLSSLRQLVVAKLPKRWGGQGDYSDALGGALSSKDSLEYAFRVPADSAAGALLQRDADGVRAMAEAGEQGPCDEWACRARPAAPILVPAVWPSHDTLHIPSSAH